MMLACAWTESKVAVTEESLGDASKQRPYKTQLQAEIDDESYQPSAATLSVVILSHIKSSTAHKHEVPNRFSITLLGHNRSSA